MRYISILAKWSWPMASKSVTLVVSRNEFYLKTYRAIGGVFILLLLITILLIGFSFYQVTTINNNPKYFPTTPDGRLIEMPPVDINHLRLDKVQVNSATGVIKGMPPPVRTYAQLEPEGENALIKYWAYLAVLDMFDYDYVHYRAEIQNSSKYFTPSGFERFKAALISSRNLETVKLRSAVVIPEINGPVKLLGTKMVSGRFAWDLEIPLKLTYESTSTSTPLVQTLLANLSIARVSTLRSPFYGLAIYKLNFEQIFNNE